MTRTDEDAMKSALLFNTPWGAGGGFWIFFKTL